MYYSINTLILTISFLFSMFRLPELLRNKDCISLSEPKFKKLVYLVIDGLRFDGFIPVNKKGLYYNNFNFTKDTDKLKTTFLSVASIPTVTKCRIMGLMTGAPNNQIEEIMSFFMSKVNVDSFPDKFANRKMKFYGDDLWVKSFDVLKDRSTSFCGLSKNSLEEKEMMLIDEIKRDKDYDIKFIHIISLDALGHIYGTEHSRIKQALERADGLICDIYEEMDEDTLFVVTSDHGVTDKGAHGGSSSPELASVFGVYSKKNIEIFDGSEHIYNEAFIDKFYNTKDTNTENDWIKPINPYKIVQQDDILPTVAYFMGVSTPTNTYGNLIPYLVNDMEAQKILADQKLVILKEDTHIKENDSLIEANYKITKAIYERLSKTYPLLAFATFTLGTILIMKMYRGLKDVEFFSFSSVILSVIMVSHSYWSFVSEDYIWGFAYLINNISLSNIIFVVAYFIASGRVFFETDRITSVILREAKSELLYSISDIVEDHWHYIFMFLMGAFAITRLGNKVFLKNCIRIAPQLSFLLYSTIFEAGYTSKITFLCTYPSIESLLTVHMKPAITVLLIYFLENLDVKMTQTNRYILLQLSTFIIDIEKVIPSIDYQVFFALSEIYGSISCYTGAFAYLFIPRYLVIKKAKIGNQGRLLDLFSMLFCYISSWVMRITIVFQNFFIGRLIFTILFFYTDRIIELGVGLHEKCLFIMNSKAKRGCSVDSK